MRKLIFTVRKSSYGIINDLELKGTENVLVTSGSSSTSLFVISALRNKVRHITVLTSQEYLCERIKKLGADEVVVIRNRQRINESPLQKLVSRLNGFDVIIGPFLDIYLHQLFNRLKKSENI